MGWVGTGQTPLLPPPPVQWAAHQALPLGLTPWSPRARGDRWHRSGLGRGCHPPDELRAGCRSGSRGWGEGNNNGTETPGQWGPRAMGATVVCRTMGRRGTAARPTAAADTAGRVFKSFPGPVFLQGSQWPGQPDGHLMPACWAEGPGPCNKEQLWPWQRQLWP